MVHPQNKASTNGSLLGGAVATLFVWAAGLDPTPEQMGALVTVSAAVVGFATAVFSSWLSQRQ